MNNNKKATLFSTLVVILSTDEARSKPGKMSLNKKIMTGEQELLVRQCPGRNPI